MSGDTFVVDFNDPSPWPVDRDDPDERACDVAARLLAAFLGLDPGEAIGAVSAGYAFGFVVYLCENVQANVAKVTPRYALETLVRLGDAVAFRELGVAGGRFEVTIAPEVAAVRREARARWGLA